MPFAGVFRSFDHVEDDQHPLEPGLTRLERIQSAILDPLSGLQESQAIVHGRQDF